MSVVYRVVLQVGLYEIWFKFDSAMEATCFAETALRHAVSADVPGYKIKSVTIEMISTEREEKD